MDDIFKLAEQRPELLNEWERQFLKSVEEQDFDMTPAQETTLQKVRLKLQSNAAKKVQLVNGNCGNCMGSGWVKDERDEYRMNRCRCSSQGFYVRLDPVWAWAATRDD